MLEVRSDQWRTSQKPSSRSTTRTTPRSRRSSAPTTRGASPTRASRSSRSTRAEDIGDGERLGEPGEYPFTRGAAPRDVPQAALDDAPVRGLRVGQGVQRALPLPAQAGRHRALDGLRPADPARPGLRRPALPRRGRPHRRRDRLDRGHADRLRRHPARQDLDVDDDQRARPRACCCSTTSSPRSRACRPSSCAARRRTTSSRSTSPAGTTSTRPGRPCA